MCKDSRLDVGVEQLGRRAPGGAACPRSTQLLGHSGFCLKAAALKGHDTQCRYVRVRKNQVRMHGCMNVCVYTSFCMYMRLGVCTCACMYKEVDR